MSGTDPRGRKARREQTVKRVRNPVGGTYWGLESPGQVDLRADVAVGARNPMRAAGAAQDSGGGSLVCPGGELKPMGVSGASAPESEPRKTAWPSKRRGGGREPNSGYGARACSERRATP
jgi:hypothetical protein